jgi:hypothetical protein
VSVVSLESSRSKSMQRTSAASCRASVSPSRCQLSRRKSNVLPGRYLHPFRSITQPLRAIPSPPSARISYKKITCLRFPITLPRNTG